MEMMLQTLARRSQLRQRQAVESGFSACFLARMALSQPNGEPKSYAFLLY
jgi:hypothetical protein